MFFSNIMRVTGLILKTKSDKHTEKKGMVGVSEKSFWNFAA